MLPEYRREKRDGYNIKVIFNDDTVYFWYECIKITEDTTIDYDFMRFEEYINGYYPYGWSYKCMKIFIQLFGAKALKCTLSGNRNSLHLRERLFEVYIGDLLGKFYGVYQVRQKIFDNVFSIGAIDNECINMNDVYFHDLLRETYNIYEVNKEFGMLSPDEDCLMIKLILSSYDI